MRIVPLAGYTVVALAIAQGWLKTTALAQTAGTRDSLYYQNFVEFGSSELGTSSELQPAPPAESTEATPEPAAEVILVESAETQFAESDASAEAFPVPTMMPSAPAAQAEMVVPDAQETQAIPAAEATEPLNMEASEPPQSEDVDSAPPEPAEPELTESDRPVFPAPASEPELSEPETPAPDAIAPAPSEVSESELGQPELTDPDQPVFPAPASIPEPSAPDAIAPDAPELTEPDQSTFPSPTAMPSGEEAPLPEPLMLDFPTPTAPQQSQPQPAPALPAGELAIQVAEVNVEGGDPALQEVIRAQVQARAGGMTTEEQLRRDVDALLSTGLFAQVTVRTEARPNGTLVSYVVEPIVVRSLRIQGARAIDEAIPNQAFAPQVGQPVNLEILRQGADQVNQWYQDNGFTLSRVVSALPNPEGVLTIVLAEVMVNQVNIRFLNREGSDVDEDGNPVEGRTQEEFVRQVVELQPGQLFSEQTAQADLQRISQLGLFERATVDVKAINDTSVDVTYNLVEQLSRRFNLGGGVSDDVGLYGSVTYEDTNLGGVGNRLSADVRASGRGIEFGTRFTSPYREFYPDRLGYSFHASSRSSLSVALSDEVTLENGDRIREQRLRFGASVMRPLGEWDAELGLNYTRYTMTDSDGEDFSEDAEGNPITFSDTGTDDLITVLFQATRDLRDNPLNPREGSVLTLSAEQSIPIGNGNIFMNRLQANYATYLPVDILGNSTERYPEVLAFNLQGGTILGDAPPYYSFNLGGTNSVRGYGEGDVGTGRTYALASVEYRFPLFRPVGAALFADFATDFGTADDVFGQPAEARNKPGTGFGAGAGIRVDSPFGLLRLDFGVNDEGESRVHFGFGQRF